MIKDVFAAFKYQDVDGSQINPLHEDEDKSYKVVLYDIPGGNLSNADYGDQVMRSWDVGEFCFSRKPHRNYGFVVSLWAEFDQSEPRIFVIDPEMDIGLNLI